MTAIARLAAAATANGCRLFTLSAVDPGLTCFARIHTSHPAEYPLSGIKPFPRDAWFDHVVTRRQSFLANSPQEFAALFPDHALITGMGLGSCLNIPVFAKSRLAGTANFLAEAGHFSPQALESYHAMTRLAHRALIRAMLAPLPGRSF